MTSSTDGATQCIGSSLQLVILILMVNSPSWTTEEAIQKPTRPAEDVTILTKGLQELTLPIEWTTVKPGNIGIFNSDSTWNHSIGARNMTFKNIDTNTRSTICFRLYITQRPGNCETPGLVVFFSVIVPDLIADIHHNNHELSIGN